MRNEFRPPRNSLILLGSVIALRYIIRNAFSRFIFTVSRTPSAAVSQF
jgi:hypothetical protein